MISTEALRARGRELHLAGDLPGAEQLYRRVVELDPGDAKTWCLLGMVCSERGALEEAVRCYRESLRIDPLQREANHNLGNALLEMGEDRQAIAQIRRTLEIAPDFPECHKSLGLALLRQGDLAAGWPEYEWRLKCDDKGQPRTYSRLWDGSPQPGGTILLVAEQGLGDAIQFVRYAPMVRQRCARVVLECPRALMRPLERAPGIDAVVPRNAPLQDFAAEAPLLSLPRLLGTTLENIPAQVPYLSADPQLTEYWRQVLSSIRGMKVGLVWQGNPGAPVDKPRSMPFSRFAGLRDIEGVQFISLQKGAGSEQLAEGTCGLPVIDLGERLDGQSGPFMDTAAIIMNLDLVITVDTAVAHLAGALGAPVWILLSYAADWRWLTGRDDSPWYPTARLFRQTRRGDWDGVIERVAEALRAQRQRKSDAQPAPPLLAPVSAGELLDKITILQIKAHRIGEPAKLGHVLAELAALSARRDRAIAPSPELASLVDELRDVNRALWDIEDEIRRCEQRQDFGTRFVELARSVYRENDRRAAIKRRINGLVDSELVEEKLYSTSAAGAPAPAAAPAPLARPVLESGPLRLKRCRHGIMLYAVRDRYIGRSLDLYGEFSEGEMEVIGQIVRRGQLVLDIGANIGTHTVVLSRLVGGGGSVLAFEPQRQIFQILCANVALNALSNVHTYHAAVGRQCGNICVPRMNLESPDNFGGVSLNQKPGAGEIVRLITVDSLELPACHFMKVDVEGMENEVLAGAEQTIRKYRPILYVENDREKESAALISRLLELDYRLYWHLPRLYTAKNHFANPQNVFGNTISVNVLAIPKSAKQNISGLREITSPQDTWQTR